jgi:hypothetical protein
MVKLHLLKEEKDYAICFNISFIQSWSPQDKIHDNSNLFVSLNVPNNLMMHWSDGFG